MKDVNPPTAWFLWFAILSGLCIIQMFAGGGVPSGSDQGSPPVALVGVCAVAAFASIAIRFLVIPGRKNLPQMVTLMIIGLALAEGCGILGMFIIPAEFPRTKLWILATAVICILLHAPIYAKRPTIGSDGYVK